MSLLIVLGVLFQSLSIDAIRAPIPPKIDGFLETVWQNADSCDHFIDISPVEGEPVSEPTKVYVLWDSDNLYVAFRCVTLNRKPDARVTPRDYLEGDQVYLYLDTFGDKRTAYLFGVSAAGVQCDALVSGDGRDTDLSYDGVWYSAVRLYDNCYTVEICVPFKSIRYRKGLKVWGVNFVRKSPVRGGEEATWAPMKRKEGMRVSRFGELRGISPTSKGLNLELYPVFLAKSDLSQRESSSPQLGFDASWAPTPSSRLQITVNPDFAQVEADPFRVNLSKYEQYFAEKRPFFTEGAEIFHAVGCGYGGRPLELFYSRRIGRKLYSGEEVPILFGARYIFKTSGWEGGALFARTEKTEGLYETEPDAVFSVLRLKKQILGNSTWGFLYASKDELSPRSYQRVFSSETVLRKSNFQYLLQIAETYSSSFEGSPVDRGALKTAFEWKPSVFHFSGSFEFVGDSFDVSKIGYVPWRGTTSGKFCFGSTIYPRNSKISVVSAGLSYRYCRESWEPRPSHAISFQYVITLLDIGGLNLHITKEKECEDTLVFDHIDVSAGINSDWSKPFRAYVWANLGKGYYDWIDGVPVFRLAKRMSAGGGVMAAFSHRVNAKFDVMSWFKYTEDNVLSSVTVTLRPWIQFALFRNISLKFYSELNLTGSSLSDQEEFSRMFAFLVSYNFAPKSWLYVGFNDFEEKENSSFEPLEQRGLVKVKYLFYF